MPIPNHSTESRKIRVINQNDAAVIATPDEFTLLGLKSVSAKYAICHGKNVNENGI
jgi:hypothetical protein